MLTYLRRQERFRDTTWSRLASRFRGAPRYIEQRDLPQDLSERRLNRRVLSYWEERRAGRVMPRLGDIRGCDLGEDWNHCFILDTREDYGFSKFEYLGPGLAKFSGVFLSGPADWTYTVLDKATEQVSKCLMTEGAVICEDTLTLFDGRVLLFRSVLLPLSDDGRRITHLLGAANGKFDEAGEG